MSTRTEMVLEALGLKIAARRGGRAWLLCPFHDDHSPTSFFVRIRGNRAGQNHCFACKNGGSMLALVMHVRRCDETQARAFIRLLGEKYEPPRKRVVIVERPAVLGRVRFVMPKGVHFLPLPEWVSLARLEAESRGITEEERELYGLGYAVDGRLAGRVVIPWLGAGRVVAGYSARTFVDEEPKYQTPQPSEHPDRSVMVGEHLWPAPHERSIIAVVEGAFNGIAFQRVFPAIPFAALGGSEIDPVHVVKLATFSRVLILTDPDAAGDKAAASLAGMLGRHCATSRVRLPPKLDVVDLVMRRGRDALRSIVEPHLAKLCA